jgi:protein-disulfide isomerase
MHIRGDPKAPITLEEFGDFQCPPCGLLAPAIKQIERDYGQRLCVIFRNLPLDMHPHARQAASAAEAAGLQDHFWEMHDLLYREQGVWSSAPDAPALFNSYAGILGLDVERFKMDMESDKVKARVSTDKKRADELGVTNTPTVFVNNRAVQPISMNALRAAIKEAETPANENPK